MHMQKGKAALGGSKFSITLNRVLFMERPDVGSGANMRAFIHENLRAVYGVEFNSITKEFTIVTDAEASIARMAISSVSSRVCPCDEK